MCDIFVFCAVGIRACAGIHVSLGFSVVGVFKQVFGMGFFSRRVSSAVPFCFTVHVPFFFLFQCWEFGRLIRNCPKSSVNASSSDRAPNRGWQADPEWSASDVDVDVVETDEYPLIDDYLGSGVEFVEGFSGVKGRLKQCISY